MPDRIRELCEQLLRAEHPLVIESVAVHLQRAIQAYVEGAKQNVAGVPELLAATARRPQGD